MVKISRKSPQQGVVSASCGKNTNDSGPALSESHPAMHDPESLISFFCINLNLKNCMLYRFELEKLPCIKVTTWVVGSLNQG